MTAGARLSDLWRAPFHDFPVRDEILDQFLPLAYTAPSFRGRGVASALITTACRRLRDEGIEIAWATVEIRNTASQRAFARCGFEAVGHVTAKGWLRPPPHTARWRHEPGSVGGQAVS